MILQTALSFLCSKEFRFYWLPPLLLTAGIMIFSGDFGSSQKTRSFIWQLLSQFLSPYWIAQINHYLRIAGHMLTYGCLYILWARAFGEHLGCTHWRRVFWSLGLCLAVALADEGHQSPLPTRSGSLRDVGLDMASAVLAAMFAYLFRTLQIVRRKSAL